MKRRAGFPGRLLLALAFAAPCGMARAQTAAPPSATPAVDDVRRLLSEGQTHLRNRAYEKAVASIYAGIEELRRRGRETSRDMGVANLLLARALAGIDHPQTDDAYAGAVNLLAPGADLRLYTEAAAELLARLENRGDIARADALVAGWLARTGVDGVPESARAFAIARADGYFNRTGRPDEARRALGNALTLPASTPDVARLRGVARFFRAIAAAEAGDVETGLSGLDDAIADLRRAGDAGAGDLGVALHGRGALLVRAGLYESERHGLALDFLNEAAPLLEASGRPERGTNVSLRLRLLYALNMHEQGVALARRDLEWTRARHGEDARETRLARLELVSMAIAGGLDDPEIERIANAENAALEAEAHEASARGEPGVWRDPRVAAKAAEMLAGARLAASAFHEAIYYAEHAIALHRSAEPENPAAKIVPLRYLAEAARGVGTPDIVERVSAELISTTERVHGRDHVETARDLGDFAGFLSEIGRAPEAEPLLRRVIAIYERAFGARRARVAPAAQNLALTLSMLGRHAEAERLYSRVLALLANDETMLAERALVIINRAEQLTLLDRAEEALVAIDEARPVLARATATTQNAQLEFLARSMRVRALLRLGRLSEALIDGLAALENARPRLDDEARAVALTYTMVAEIASRSRVRNLALQLARKAREVEEAFGLKNPRVTRDVALGLVTAALDLADD